MRASRILADGDSVTTSRVCERCHIENDSVRLFDVNLPDVGVTDLPRKWLCSQCIDTCVAIMKEELRKLLGIYG